VNQSRTLPVNRHDELPVKLQLGSGFADRGHDLSFHAWMQEKITWTTLPGSEKMRNIAMGNLLEQSRVDRDSLGRFRSDTSGGIADAGAATSHRGEDSGRGRSFDLVCFGLRNLAGLYHFRPAILTPRPGAGSAQTGNRISDGTLPQVLGHAERLPLRKKAGLPEFPAEGLKLRTGHKPKTKRAFCSGRPAIIKFLISAPPAAAVCKECASSFSCKLPGAS
jgi:hypothetical protein